MLDRKTFRQGPNAEWEAVDDTHNKTASTPS